MYDYLVQHASLIYKFTGKERDAESGLDNFGARYDASSMGRFMSADPVFISADRLTDPQSLNLYAYVRTIRYRWSIRRTRFLSRVSDLGPLWLWPGYER